MIYFTSDLHLGHRGKIGIQDALGIEHPQKFDALEVSGILHVGGHRAVLKQVQHVKGNAEGGEDVLQVFGALIAAT